MNYVDAIDALKRAAARKNKRLLKAKTLNINKKPKKVPKATLRKRLINKLDIAFSLYIRGKRPDCTFCHRPVEHCFHFVTRGKHSVRWDERNAVASCAGCNYRYEFDPHFAITWFLNTHGTVAYEELVEAGNKIAKFSNDDLEGLLKVGWGRLSNGH